MPPMAQTVAAAVIATAAVATAMAYRPKAANVADAARGMVMERISAVGHTIQKIAAARDNAASRMIYFIMVMALLVKNRLECN